MPTPNPFLTYENPRYNLSVPDDLAHLAQHPAAENISDTKDAQGHRYVDLVMEGGGVLGFALAGYAYALEHANIRFRSIGGTSAGAITATILAAAAPPDRRRAAFLLNALTTLDLNSFMDGHEPSKRAVNKFLSTPEDKRSTLFWISLITPLLPHITGILKRKGLFQGNTFRDWLHNTITAPAPNRAPIHTLDDLCTLLNQLPPLIINNEPPSTTHGLHPALGLITAEITTHSTATLPRHAHAFWNNSAQTSPADFARASMSVPIFFQPIKHTVPTTDTARALWSSPAALNFKGRPPKHAILQDGGLVSNFPIDMFHNRARRVPRLPTLGARLGESRTTIHPVTNALNLLTNGFATARQARDAAFIQQNPDFKQLVAEIDTRDINWLNFNLPPQDQHELFARGTRAARTFLDNFDFQRYKHTRAQRPC